MLATRTGPLFPALMTLWLSGGPALADEPLPLAEDKLICSPSGVYCAEISAAAWRTTVFREGQARWSMPGWFDDPYLADDGKHLVIGNQQMGLLPVRYHPPITILTFWRRGELVRKVPLSEVVVDPSNLRLTGSHRKWGRTIGFDARGRFLVQTVENRVLAFDVESGDLLEAREEP